MLVAPPNTRIYLYDTPTDMRKSFNTLSILVANHLGKNASDGAMYVFFNKAKNKIKILHWHQGGFWLHYKNLAKGKFCIPKVIGNDLESAELYYMLENIKQAAENNKKIY